MKTSKFKPCSFLYSKDLLPSLEKAATEFEKQTYIKLTDIRWEIVGNSLVIYIDGPQEEKWLFHLGVLFGQTMRTQRKK